MNVFRSLLLMVLLAGCSGSKGTPGRVPNTSNTVIHSLRISHHIRTTISNSRADRILDNMRLHLVRIDIPQDVTCDVAFRRSGRVSSFINPAHGYVLNSADFNSVGSTSGVKVVYDVLWCGGLKPNAIGCANVPGNFLVVERYDQRFEGQLWAHEFGHNQGLQHRIGDLFLMNDSLEPNTRVVNQSECDKFKTP